MRTAVLALLITVALAGLTACSVDDGSGAEERPTTTTEAADATPSSTTTTTTLPPSVGLVDIAGETHEIVATCYAPGAGEVLAIGVAELEDRRIEVFLQALLGAPYLGISVMGEEAAVYEAAIDRPLDISYEGDVLRVDDVALVTDLDLETGQGTDAGVGSVVVECRAYEAELPPGFLVG